MAKNKKKKANSYVPIVKNKKGRILVTFAGGNDPLGRGVYKKEEDSKEQNAEKTNYQPNSREEISTDGPIIRICRFYRPEKYTFF